MMSTTSRSSAKKEKKCIYVYVYVHMYISEKKCMREKASQYGKISTIGEST